MCVCRILAWTPGGKGPTLEFPDPLKAILSSSEVAKASQAKESRQNREM